MPRLCKHLGRQFFLMKKNQTLIAGMASLTVSESFDLSKYNSSGRKVQKIERLWCAAR